MSFTSLNFYITANTTGSFVRAGQGKFWTGLEPDPDTFVPGQFATVEERLQKIEKTLFGCWETVDLGDDDD